MFWPNGSDQPAMLDRSELLTLWEYEEGKFDVIDGNHRIALFLKHGIQVWSCRIISTEYRMTSMDIRRMADFCNDKHNGAAVHATYWERLTHIKEVMPNHKVGNGYKWNDIALNFVSGWYTIANLKRAGTTINAFKDNEKVRMIKLYSNNCSAGINWTIFIYNLEKLFLLLQLTLNVQIGNIWFQLFL